MLQKHPRLGIILLGLASCVTIGLPSQNYSPVSLGVPLDALVKVVGVCLIGKNGNKSSKAEEETQSRTIK